MIGYICLNKRKMDLKHVRYEIGKIYKSKINCFDTLENLLMYYQWNMRFFKVTFSEKNMASNYYLQKKTKKNLCWKNFQVQIILVL